MEVPTPTASHCVLGLTIALPEPWADRVRRVRREVGDPLAEAVAPHITLLPPTLVPRDGLREITAHVEQVVRRTEPFELRAAGARTFRPVSPVVYLDVVTGAERVDALQRSLRHRDGPLAGDLRFPFHAHITLAHVADDAVLDAAASAGSTIDATFVVEQVHIHLLQPDSTWRLLGAPVLGSSLVSGSCS